MTPIVTLIACLADNYAVLVHDPDTGTTVLVDAPEAAPIEAALSERGWHLTAILITHHHSDHVGGLARLKDATGALTAGPAAEAHRIAGLDRLLAPGEPLVVGPFRIEVIGVPGHTLGHVAFHFPDQQLLFAGDTLFAMGCGRLFEADADTMWTSLNRLAVLPDETTVYCGHEYTLSNARFAATVDPTNAVLAARVKAVEAARAAGSPTIPSTIGLEKATNPFLRAGDPAIAAAVALAGAAPAAVFAELRRRKDRA